jgi:hypothetical protein
VKETIKRLVTTHDKLGDSIQSSILALWRFCADYPEWRDRTAGVHDNLDKALELFHQCSKDLETVAKGVERCE